MILQMFAFLGVDDSRSALVERGSAKAVIYDEVWHECPTSEMPSGAFLLAGWEQVRGHSIFPVW